MTYISLAALLFVGTHLGLSSTGLRARLVAQVGERGFLVVYSLVAAVTLSYLIWLYNILPRYEYLWMPSPELHTVAKVLMPVALILVMGGFMVRNPTVVGAEGLLNSDAAARDLARGVTRITRHPFQWGVLIWSVTHVLANGDVISVVFFSAFGVLAAAGTVAMDRKKARKLSDAWQAYASTTSNVPFLAIFTGRNRLVLRELWLPVLVGLAGYAALAWGHVWVSGVRIL
jgi:uncharacterized membrane protein